MNSILPNINERSAMNRPYLPPIEETYSRAEVDAIVAAALAKAAGDMDSLLRRQFIMPIRRATECGLAV